MDPPSRSRIRILPPPTQNHPRHPALTQSPKTTILTPNIQELVLPVWGVFTNVIRMFSLVSGNFYSRMTVSNIIFLLSEFVPSPLYLCILVRRTDLIWFTYYSSVPFTDVCLVTGLSVYSHRPVVLFDLRPVMGMHGAFDFSSNLVSTRLGWT